MSIRKLHDRLIAAAACQHKRQRKVMKHHMICLDCGGHRKIGQPWRTRIA